MHLAHFTPIVILLISNILANRYYPVCALLTVTRITEVNRIAFAKVLEILSWYVLLTNNPKAPVPIIKMSFCRKYISINFNFLL